MSDISNSDKMRLEELFGMKTGYVLDFSNASFGDFFATYGVNVFDESRYGSIEVSKANRLRAFWNLESNDLVAKAMLDMLEKWRITAIQNYGAGDPVFNIFSSTIQSLEELRDAQDDPEPGRIVNAGVAVSRLDKQTMNYLLELIFKLETRLQSADYSGVITSSRTIVEQLFISILESTDGGFDPSLKGEINKMYKEISKRLNISSEHTSDALAKIARGFNSIVDGLAQLRNAASDSHGVQYRPEKRHAILAMNSALTITTYFSELMNDKDLLKRRI